MKTLSYFVALGLAGFVAFWATDAVDKHPTPAPHSITRTVHYEDGSWVRLVNNHRVATGCVKGGLCNQGR
jgi:hypothetical protein